MRTCYRGATEGQIAACKVEVDPEGVEAELLQEREVRGETIIAFALARR